MRNFSARVGKTPYPFSGNSGTQQSKSRGGFLRKFLRAAACRKRVIRRFPACSRKKTVSSFHNAPMPQYAAIPKIRSLGEARFVFFYRILRALRARGNAGLRKPFCRRLRWCAASILFGKFFQNPGRRISVFSLEYVYVELCLQTYGKFCEVERVKPQIGAQIRIGGEGIYGRTPVVGQNGVDGRKKFLLEICGHMKIKTIKGQIPVSVKLKTEINA